MRQFFAALATVLITHFITQAGWGATYHVPSQFPTIDQAVQFAQPGDTIVVAPGTYSHADINKPLTLQSSGGPEVTFITNGINAWFGFSFPTSTLYITGFSVGQSHFQDQYENVVISNCVIESANSAGLVCQTAVSCDNCLFQNNHEGAIVGELTEGLSSFTNCTFVGNHAGLSAHNPVEVISCIFQSNDVGADVIDAATVVNSDFLGNVVGAAVWGESSSATFQTCTFNDNVNPQSGAALYAEGPVTVSECTFTGNSAGLYGGALYLIMGAESSFTSCVFQNNLAGSGGAVATDTDALISANFVDCDFLNNDAQGWGGAIYGVRGRLVANNCDFTDNGALKGGAIYTLFTLFDMSLESCNLAFNVAESDGGGLFSGSAAIVTGCTFSDNVAKGSGGALYMTGVLGGIFSQCTFQNNAATEGGACTLFTANSTATGFANCLFTSNIGLTFGGAMHVRQGRLQANGTQFLSNSCDAGGAVHVASTAALSAVTSCTFTLNDANEGGGLYAAKGVTVTGSQFIDNFAIGIGGGASILGPSTFENCTFSGNTVGEEAFGGGLHLAGAASNTNPAIVNLCNFQSNEADYGGGVAIRSNGSAEFADCQFTTNLAFIGGGAYLHEGNGVFETCTFDSNQSLDGGAMSAWAQAQATVTDCIFQFNAAEYGGGFSLMDTGTVVTITQTDFIANGADYGGGLQVDAGGSARMNECVFDGNVALITGGAIDVANTDASIDVSGGQFVNNDADDGGAVFVYGRASATIENTSLNMNAAVSGGALSMGGAGGAADLSSCTIGSNAAGQSGGALYVAADNTLIATSCTITGNSAQADGGGALVEPQGTLNLATTTICKNEPNNVSGDWIDQGGNEICDKKPDPIPGDTNGDSVVNVADLLIVINGWGACPQPCPPSLPKCPADTNEDCLVNVLDLLTVINNWG
jgi:predicted outer membrane repeat protein